MQKNDRFYTFPFTNKTKSKKPVKQIEISKTLVHKCATAIILTVALAVFAGVIKNSAFAKSNTNVPVQAVLIEQPIQKAAEYKSISYRRPAESDLDISYEGEAIKEYQNATDADKSEFERQIETIIKNSNPAFLPTMWAHFGKINNEFGFRRNPFTGGGSEFHPGMDIDGEKGDVVVAPANGIVSKASWQGGYGNMVEIDHGNGLITRYGHLSQINIPAGSAVQRGQLIGLVGSTGRSTGAHLHFEVRMNNRPLNPRRFLPSAPTEIAAFNAH
jgi:murein DD-endopeptidase MepM/ murein hydrolase activator NlpD